MKLSYNVTGIERKALVGAISQELNEPTKYLRAPTFGGYHIDKNGTVIGSDNLDLEDALHQQGFDAVEREYNKFDTYESGSSPEELEAEIYAKREMRRLKLEDEQIPDYSNRGQYGGDDIPETEELAVEMLLDGFTPEKLDNIFKMIKAKGSLLKAALGVGELPIQQTEGTLRFPWFSPYSDADEVQAYITLIAKLCEAAKSKTRVAAKEQTFENPKYAMRCWLLSLGFIGDEYKVIRKILLKNLPGNSAYRSGAKKDMGVDDDVSK